MTPRISVIIPVYNGADFIGEAIESVLAQEYPAHEILVIDDGSTDNTPTVLKGFGNKIIQKRIPNSGPSGARNEALKLVTGDWIAFLDADDLWFKHKLKKQVEAVIKYPEVGFVCCDYAVRYDFLKFRMVRHHSILKNTREMNFDTPLVRDAFELLIKENFVGTPSAFIVKKSVADAVGFFSRLYPNSQDFDYQLRAALVTPFLILSEVLFYKRTHGGNISANKLKHYSGHKQILLDTWSAHRALIKERRLVPVLRRSIAATDYHYGDSYFDAGQKARAFGIYVRALLEDPSPRNVITFGWICFKKSLRALTGGVVRRRRSSR